MKRFVALLVIFGGFSGSAFAQSNAPTPVFPDSWSTPPNSPAQRNAWMLGAREKSGPYIIRVRLAANGRVPPHTHPDERSTTVMSRTIYVGFGETFDESKVVAVPTGAVYVAPANVPHYVWAKDGDAEYQEGGVGPTGTVFLKR